MKKNNDEYDTSLDIDNYSILSRLLLLWISPKVFSFQKILITADEIWHLRKDSNLPVLRRLFKEKFDIAKGNIWRTIFYAFKYDIFLSFLLYTFYSGLRLLAPFFLIKFIRHLEDEKDVSLGAAYGYILALFLSQLLATLFATVSDSILISASIKLRTMLIQAAFDMLLSIQESSKQAIFEDEAEFVNLVLNDTQVVIELSKCLNKAILSPLMLVAATFYLFYLLGYSAFIGFALILLSLPVTFFLVFTQISVYQMKVLYSGVRISSFKEVLNGIKLVKFFNWEDAAEKYLDKIRKQELKFQFRALLVKTFNLAVTIAIPNFALILSLTVFLLVQHDSLQADTAFAALFLFNIIRAPLIFLPISVFYFLQARVSFNILEVFLNRTTNETTKAPDENKALSYEEEVVLKFLQASFSCPFSKKRELNEGHILEKIDLEIRKGELVGIVGRKGAGKTSLLLSMLGEFQLSNEDSAQVFKHSTMFSSAALCEETPFLLNASIRKNILFLSELEPGKYKDVLKEVDLEDDLNSLRFGDETEIGEQGVTLTTLQKLKVCLARSIYNANEVLLFDDPFQLIQPELTLGLFKKLISQSKTSALNRKTRIFASSQPELFPYFDRIIVLDQGRIVQQGEYKDLVNVEAGVFVQLLNELSSKLGSRLDVKPFKQIEYQSVPLENKQSLQISQHGSFLPAPTREIAKSYIASDGVVLSEKLIDLDQPRSYSILSSFRFYVGFSDSLSARDSSKACLVVLVILTLFLICEASFLAVDVWLALWVENHSFLSDFSIHQFVGGYWVLGFLFLILFILRSSVFAFTSVHFSTKLYSQMSSTLLNMPLPGFWETPLGLILRRQSQDTFSLDDQIPQTLHFLISSTVRILGAFLFIVINVPMFLVFFLPLLVYYFHFRTAYVLSARELLKFDERNNLLLRNHMVESFSGLVSLRAFNKLGSWTNSANLCFEHSHRSKYAKEMILIWAQQRLELLGHLTLLFTGFSILFSPEEVAPTTSLSALCIIHAFMLNYPLTVTSAAQLEAQAESLHHLWEYCKKEVEDKVSAVAGSSDLDLSVWPKSGSIEFRSCSVRYNHSSVPALNKATGSICSGEQVSIVGRPGSGKNTLTFALCRILDPFEGEILIDNVNLMKIPKKMIRKHISLVPQEPLFFLGTLRFNIDPFDEFSDDDLYSVLDRSHLTKMVQGLPGKLYQSIRDGGLSLSSRERSMLCVARALIRKSKIVVAVEPNISKDVENERLVQATLRQEVGKETTLIFISHHVRNAVTMNKVLVMKNGEFIESGHPHLLLCQSEPVSEFSKMVGEYGTQYEEKLRATAKEMFNSLSS